MNPSFEPILGSSFDNIGAQRFQWAQANNATDVGNINRMNEADQARNAWLLRNQQIAQQQADAQTAADAGAEKEAAAANRFNVEVGLSRDQIAAQERISNRAKDEEKARTAQMVADAASKDLGRQDKIDQTGVNNAVEYGQVKRSKEAAENAQTALESQQAQAQSQYDALKAKTDRTPDENLQLASLQNSVKMDWPKQVKAAEKEAQGWTKKYDSLWERIHNQGYKIDDEGGTISHPSGKKWSFHTPQPARLAPISDTQPTWFGGQPFTPPIPGRSDPSSMRWPGFSQDADTPDTPTPANRFSVAPPVAPQAAYIAGRRYGNLRYIGGDPNDQANWQTAQ